MEADSMKSGIPPNESNGGKWTNGLTWPPPITVYHRLKARFRQRRKRRGAATGGKSERMSMYSVYILKNNEGRHYVGYTNKEINIRIAEHNHGKCCWTRNKGPWKLCYVECFKEKADAYRREKQIKKFKGGRAFKELLCRN